MVKFKDTTALENAYRSLEAEFTRRSQRLRKLQGEQSSLLKDFADQLKDCFPDDDMFTHRKYDKASICIAINKTLNKFKEDKQ